MAFPVIETADTQNGTVTSNATTWTLTYPTNLASGDLILGFVASDGTASFGWPVGWTGQISQTDAGGAVTMGIAAKISDGTETGTFSLTIGASEQGAWRLFRVTGWFGSGIPTGSGLTQVDGDGESLVGARGASGLPNPPVLDPANWATEDTLWFATCAVDTSRTITGHSLPDNQTADVSGGAGGATLAIETQSSTVSSLDPAAYSISASDDWVAYTVAVRPAAAAAPATLILEQGYIDFNDPGVY